MEINENETAVIGSAETENAPAEKTKKSILSRYEGIICLIVVFGLFYYLGQQMGMANMLNTLMHTAHDLLLNTQCSILWAFACSPAPWAGYLWNSES